MPSDPQPSEHARASDHMLVHDADEASSWSDKPWVRLVVAGHGRPAAALLLVAALLVLVFLGDTLEPWRNIAFDSHHQAAPRALERPPVQVVEIDAKSLAEVGPWPWPRHLVGDLMHGVATRGATVVGLDMVFPEPDRLSPHTIADTHGDVAEHVRDALRSVRHTDHHLADVLTELPVVLGRLALTGEAAEALVDSDAPIGPMTLSDPALLAAMPEAGAVVTNLPGLEAAARGFGILTVPADDDGVIRKAPTVLSVAGSPHPTMVTEVLRVALGAETVTVVGEDDTIDGLMIGDSFYETESDGRVRPHFTHSLDHRFISAADVLAGRVSDMAFANQIVMIGVTGMDLVGAHSTPVSGEIHGVEIHAQVIENFLEGNRLVRPEWAVGSEAAALLLIALLTILAMPLQPTWRVAAVFFVLIIGFAVGAHYAFVTRRLLLDPILPSFLGAVIFLAMLGVLLAEVDRRRRALRMALQEERVAAARVAGELSAARDIQIGMLPDAAALPGLPPTLAIDAYLQSAKQVGGDLYDVFMIDDQRLFFMVGDVTGKGVPASLFMALSKAISKSAALRGPDRAIDAIIETANVEISRENPSALFVTAFVGIIDAATGRIEFCDAGHESPHIVSADGTVREMVCDGGPPLCVVDDFSYPMEAVTLAPGDTLIITTDGVTEAQQADRTLYGRERLAAALARTVTMDVHQTVAHVVDDVRRFEAGAEPADDLTMLAIRWRGAP